MSEFAEVTLWGNPIGVVAWDANRSVGNFEYTREFQHSGIELAPRTMPLGSRIYSFPELNPESFYGLPGLLADSLPDKFGNLLINEWLLRTGRDVTSFTPVERLCYIGERGMGAMEFKPALRTTVDKSRRLELDRLVKLANEALQQKSRLKTKLGDNDEASLQAMEDILLVGTSAGGARAKAVIAWNRRTQEIRSGQVKAPGGFTYWILKFDGVSGNRDKELADPQGYGKVEYAYHLMATAAGIDMSPCELLDENGRSHFLTRRFDRTDDGKKIMMQSLCALGHFDFNQAGAYSYEQALQMAEDLGTTPDERRQLYRRMLFNVAARNHDDHTKNIAFLMDKSGSWTLSPAFDVTYSYNPTGEWTNQHQMSINGKRTDFELEDLLAVGRRFRVIGIRRAKEMLADVHEATERWPEFAERANVDHTWRSEIASHHRQFTS